MPYDPSSFEDVLSAARACRICRADFPIERLRYWLRLSPDIFYDESKIAIVPMGFCFPGNDERGGDLPPPAICAKTWHLPIRQHLSGVSLTLLIGLYAQRFYLGRGWPWR